MNDKPPPEPKPDVAKLNPPLLAVIAIEFEDGTIARMQIYDDERSIEDEIRKVGEALGKNHGKVKRWKPSKREDFEHDDKGKLKLKGTWE